MIKWRFSDQCIGCVYHVNANCECDMIDDIDVDDGCCRFRYVEDDVS